MTTPLVVPAHVANRLANPLCGDLRDWPDVRDTHGLTVLDVRWPKGAAAVEFIVLDLPETITMPPPTPPAKPTMRLTNCQSCGQAIGWITSRSGRPVPVDATVRHIRLDGPGVRITIYTPEGDVLGGAECDASRFDAIAGYVTHFATCPNSAQHRSVKPRRAKSKARR